MVFEIAAKCAPVEKILSDIEKAGIKAVELYLSKDILGKVQNVIDTCKKYDFKYAVHAPNDDFNPSALCYLVKEIESGIVVFHDIFWEDEWKEIVEKFKGVQTKLCIENIAGVYEASKFIRRYGFGRCLDIEHVQFELSGIFEEEVLDVIKHSSHIHLSGYLSGTDLWHTHIHRSEEHGKYMFDLIEKAGYSRMVVSEARVSYQKYEEFKKLREFYEKWKKNRGVK